MSTFTKFLKGEDDVLLCISKKYRSVILTPTMTLNIAWPRILTTPIISYGYEE